MNKNTVGKIFFGVGFLGLMYELSCGLFKTNGKAYLNSAEGLLIFAGSLYIIMVGALFCGEIGARGTIVRRDETPCGYWFLVIMNGLFATLLLVRGIRKLTLG